MKDSIAQRGRRLQKVIQVRISGSDMRSLRESVDGYSGRVAIVDLCRGYLHFIQWVTTWADGYSSLVTRTAHHDMLLDPARKNIANGVIDVLSIV